MLRCVVAISQIRPALVSLTPRMDYYTCYDTVTTLTSRQGSPYRDVGADMWWSVHTTKNDQKNVFANMLKIFRTRRDLTNLTRQII